MKRSSLMKHLMARGAVVLREGRRHTIVVKGQLKTQVPRHREVVDELARKLCKDLDMPFAR
ncbi:MAG: addiction module toxin, HicA family [Armatimonadetes bacterium CG_4_9_14_3_um_filter_66_14]|nr:addiction module toxin, HicA family [Armatimonadota bacterium]NCQ30707.1 addiction module toxin, HicA family [Armatimonadota bacterium]PIX44867.1 MAG: addiction module toxin, HicA family [Armatimonadetes bacterium CG_4_8_14_3_um_filter_66_20]PJB74171.1 MAG: addiction module toxin, HicA family [Armatimonadetes bacterium CG_4_9_14_3_um_filter_66_14]